MSSSRLNRYAALLLVGGLLIGGLGRAQSVTAAPRARALTPVKLILKWVTQAQFAGYFVALKKGYYAKEGLDVHIQSPGPNLAPESVVENGGADFGIDWMPSLLTQRDHGQDLVNIAQIFQTTGMRLIAFKSSHINSPADFAGKKVGVWFYGNQYQFFAWMTKLGIDPTKKFTVYHQQFEMNTFLTHKIDVASAMTYNELGVVLDSGVKLSDLNVWDYGKEGVSMLEDGIFAKRSFLNKNSDLTVRFLRASIMGWQDVVKNPAAAGKIVYDYDTLKAATLHHEVYMATEVDKLINFGPAVKQGIGYMDPAAFKRTANNCVAQKVISKYPTGAYDQSYWKKAMSSMPM
jgi:NitT/TauT family transport system substrate-binding protein